MAGHPQGLGNEEEGPVPAASMRGQSCCGLCFQLWSLGLLCWQVTQSPTPRTLTQPGRNPPAHSTQDTDPAWKDHPRHTHTILLRCDKIICRVLFTVFFFNDTENLFEKV